MVAVAIKDNFTDKRESKNQQNMTALMLERGGESVSVTVNVTVRNGDV